MSNYQVQQVRPGVLELVQTQRTSSPARPLELSPEGLVSERRLGPEQRTAARATAVKRLQRDWNELLRDPLPTVSAVPLEDNVLEWHGNLLATSESNFCGLIYHIIMRFPDTYPHQPPSVTLMGHIKHPNVVGGRICLDMLENNGYGSRVLETHVRREPYTGWSTAYSVASILIQLQSFLSERSRGHKGDRLQAERFANGFACVCGHRPGQVHPPIAPEVMRRELLEREQKKSAKEALAVARAVGAAAAPLIPAIAEVDFGEILAPRRPDICFGLFKRYREESFPFRLPEHSIAVGSFHRGCAPPAAPQSMTVVWSRDGTRLRFDSTAIDLQAAEGGEYAIYQVTPDDRRRDNPFEAWGEVYPEFDARRIPRPGGRRSLRNPRPFPTATAADTIEFELSTSAGHKHRMSARYDLRATAARVGPDSVWRMVAIDAGANGRNLLVLNVVTTSPGAHYLASIQFFLCYNAKRKGQVVSDGGLVANAEIDDQQQDEERRRGSSVPDEAASCPQQESGLGFEDLPPEMQLHIMSFLSKDDLLTAFNVNTTFAELALNAPQWGEEDLLCFHSKRTHREDVLGFPINVKLYPRRDDRLQHPPHQRSNVSSDPSNSNSTNNNIESISSTLDLLSYHSFKLESVRRSVWKEPFTHWLPAYLGRRHGRRALPLCERMVSEVVTGAPDRFEPVMAVEVFTKLMSTMVVALMSGTTHASEKAVEGYFSFLHWLLVFVERYPKLLDHINRRIGDFIADPEQRSKRVVPSLGDFISLLAVTDAYRWSDVAEPLLLESFDRNVKWVLQKFPALGNARSGADLRVDKYRLLKTFEATQVSKRFILFHAHFLNSVVKPQGRPASEVRRMLDACHGRPPPKVKALVQDSAQQLLTVDNWVDFFRGVDVPLPSPEQLTRWLRQAVWNSSRKRYHSSRAYASYERRPGHTTRDEDEDDGCRYYDPLAQ